MSKKLKTFEANEDLYRRFKAMCDTNGWKVGDKINELMKINIKEHESGNEQFKLESFADPNFVATPAFFADGRSWNYFLGKQTSEEKERIKEQVHLIDKKLVGHL